MKAISLLTLLALVLGCESGPQIQGVQWSQLVTFEGDMTCEGSGSMNLGGFASFGFEGKATAGGAATVTEAEEAEACAGVTVFVEGPSGLPIVEWRFFSGSQSASSCQSKAGSMDLVFPEGD